MDKAAKKNGLARRKAGKRGGPDENVWREARSEAWVHKLIYEVIDKNTRATPFKLVRAIVGHPMFIDGQPVEIKRKHVKRLQENGPLSFEIAYPLCRRLGTDLKKLISDLATPETLKYRNLPPNLQELEVIRLCDRCFVPPSFFPGSAPMAEAALKSSGHEQAPVALEEVSSAWSFSADKLEARYPGIGEFLKQELGLTLFHRSPLDDEFVGSVIRTIVSGWNDASEVLAWSEFLPCTFETPTFMKAHHKGLFSNMIGELLAPEDSEQLAEKFNSVGNANRERSLTRMSCDASFAFHCLISRQTVEQIIDRKGEFSHITNEHLIEEALYLEDLRERYGDRVEIYLLDGAAEKRVSQEASKEGMDSAFLLLKGTNVLHGLVRFKRGILESLTEPSRRQRFLAWMLNAKASCEENGITEVIRMFRTRAFSQGDT